MLCVKMPWNSLASASVKPVMLFWSAIEIPSVYKIRPIGRYREQPRGGDHIGNAEDTPSAPLTVADTLQWI